MVRTRSQKESLTDSIGQLFEASGSVFLITLAGLPSNDVNKLRANLRSKGATVRVVKNRLARRAAQGRPVAALDQHFRGPIAVVTHPGDPVATAKSLVDFAKDYPAMKIRAGLIDRTQVLDAAGVKTVSELPSLDQLRATLLALLQTPATQLVRLISTPASQIARAIDQNAKKASA